MIRFFRGAVLALMLVPAAGTAQDFNAGKAAYEAGDFATALREWTSLAEQGDVFAQSELGHMYANGKGVPQDDAEAVKWYLLAAEQDYPVAKFLLDGGPYRIGASVPQEDAAMARWYRLAAEQGYAPAQANLGLMYFKGQGMPQDYVTAHMWLNLGAAKGAAGAAEARDTLAKQLTPADISEAQRRAKVCLASRYQDCD